MSRQSQPTYWAEKRKDKKRRHMFSHLLKAGSLNLVPQNTSPVGCTACNENVPRPIEGGKCSILQCLFLLEESVTYDLQNLSILEVKPPVQLCSTQHFPIYFFSVKENTPSFLLLTSLRPNVPRSNGPFHYFPVGFPHVIKGRSKRRDRSSGY